jgi:hypothetical protein
MSELLLVVKDHVAVITLNAPERRNALNPEMTAELLEIIEQVDADPGWERPWSVVPAIAFAPGPTDACWPPVAERHTKPRRAAPATSTAHSCGWGR